MFTANIGDCTLFSVNIHGQYIYRIVLAVDQQCFFKEDDNDI